MRVAYRAYLLGALLAVIATGVAPVANAAVQAGRMATLIGNDRVTANYPGFRRDPGDATALAANGATGDAGSIVIRKVASLPPTAAFTLDIAKNIALSHPHMISERYEDELARTLLAVKNTVACSRPAYGFVVKRKMRLHGAGGYQQEWIQADTYVLELVGSTVWQATYERTYGPDVDTSISSLIAFTGHFCVQAHYLK